MFRKMSIGTRIALGISVLMILIFVVFTVIMVGKTRETSKEQAIHYAEEMAGRYGNKIRLNIEKALEASWAGAASFMAFTEHKDSADRDIADEVIKKIIESDPMFYGIQVVIKPNEFDGRDAEMKGQRDWYGPNGEYGPYFWRENGEFKVVDMHRRNPGVTRSWYKIPRDTGKPILTEPYYSDVVKDVFATVSVPIIKKGQFLGIVGIDFAIGSFQDMVKNIKPMGSGYAFLASHDGYCVAYPDAEMRGKNILEAFPESERSRIKEAMAAGKVFHKDMVMPKDGREYFVLFEPIEISGTTTPWVFGVAIPTSTIYADSISVLKLSTIVSVIAILLVIGTVLVIARKVSKPIGAMVEFARNIADGDFDSRPDEKQFIGELEELNVALNQMIGSLVESISTADEKTKEAEEQTIAANKALEEAREAREASERARSEGMLHAASQLDEIVTNVISASEKLSELILEAHNGSGIQRARTTESATAMEQMNASVLEVARNASRAAESAMDAKHNAEEGGKIVSDVVNSINHVNTASEKMVKGLTDLGSKADGINQIITVITDIADQTNLLALNAAIEAARAGDAGRGFAVVADEVRKLAEKTMQVTDEVEDAVHNIQSETKKNMDEMKNAADMVEKSTEYAGQAGDSLNTIVTIVEDTADQVRAIATASEEQSAASEQINRGTEEVNRIAAETAGAMDESRNAVQDLTRLSAELQDLIVMLKKG